MKRKAEQTRINFDSSNEEEYNKDFPYRELENVLCRLNDTGPEPDGVRSSMLKNMPECEKQQLLKVINVTLKPFFSNALRKAIIILQ